MTRDRIVTAGITIVIWEFRFDIAGLLTSLLGMT